VRRGEGEDEGGAASRKKEKKKKKKKKRTNARGRGWPGGIPGRRELLDPCQQSAPLALQCCRTNRRIARTNPPDARVLRARPRRARSVGPPRGDRRGVASARGRAGGSARASIAAHAPVASRR